MSVKFLKIKDFITVSDTMKFISEQQKYRESVYNKWKDLEKELKTKNRYFPKNEFLDEFISHSNKLKYYLEKGTILYRARKISENEFPDKVQMLIDYIIEKNKYNISITQIIDEKSFIKFIKDMPSDEWKEGYIKTNNLQELLFWGYNKDGSDAPSSTDISIPPGRANPSGISYLYTAIDVPTAISEVQPSINQFISISEISTLKKLNLFNFDYFETQKDSELKKPLDEIEDKSEEDIPSWKPKIYFDILTELFSKPVLNNTEYYYITQYLSEYLKNNGFDGLKFNSSLYKGGYNIVLFDTSKDEDNNPRNYEILNSSLHIVENVTITSSKIFPK
jgi:hypothetical protein